MKFQIVHFDLQKYIEENGDSVWRKNFIKWGTEFWIHVFQVAMVCAARSTGVCWKQFPYIRQFFVMSLCPPFFVVVFWFDSEDEW